MHGLANEAAGTGARCVAEVDERFSRSYSSLISPVLSEHPAALRISRGEPVSDRRHIVLGRITPTVPMALVAFSATRLHTDGKTGGAQRRSSSGQSSALPGSGERLAALWSWALAGFEWVSGDR